MSEGRLLYIYAVVDEVPADLGLGLDGAPLRAIGDGAPTAVVSEHEEPPEAGEDALWQHEAVAERLMEGAAVLPMRFGTTVADAAQLAALLRAREDEFVELLAVVRGAVELSVRAELAAADADPDAGEEAASGSSGIDYMRERGRALRSVEQAKEHLHGPLKDLSRRAMVLEARDARGWERTFHGAYLVDAGRVDAFAARVDGLAAELGGEATCTGPWPPYSFVAGAER